MRFSVKSKTRRFIGIALCLVLMLNCTFMSNILAYAEAGGGQQTSELSDMIDGNVSSLYGNDTPETSQTLGLTEGTEDIVFDFNKDFSSSNTQNSDGSGLSSDEEAYIESVIEALAQPAGALGFDDVNGSEPVDVIVWLQNLPGVLVEAYGAERAAAATAEFSGDAQSTLNRIQRMKSANVTIKYVYEDVFSGLAMTVPASMIEQLAEMPGVYAVIPDELLYADSTVQDPNYEIAGMAESRKVMNIADLHAAGFTGAGVIVGVIDTGVDYNHPDIKDAFRGGWDYIGGSASVRNRESNDPMETTYEEWQRSTSSETDSSGYTYYTSHGTHVCGTIVAQAKNDSNIQALGVSPDVDLYVARVLGPYGSGAQSGIIAAINDFAVGNEERGIPKADVINLSLGGGNNTAYGAHIFAINNAVISGVNAAKSAGNSGSADGTTDGRALGTLTPPSTAYLAVTVGATQYGGKDKLIYESARATAGAFSVDFGILIEGYNTTNVFEDNLITGNPAPVYVEGKGYELFIAINEDDTSLADWGNLDGIEPGSLAGKILVVKRGGGQYIALLPKAKDTGAAALIIVNSAAGGEEYLTNTTVSVIRGDHLPVLTTFGSVSLKLLELAQNGDPLYLNLNELSKYDQAKEPAYFSSLGPVAGTMGIKPEVTAPGWQIFSTQPAFLMNADHNATDYTAAYGLMSGTSMSTPHVAGILALMVQAFPDASPAEIKARLVNTAERDFIMADAAGHDASVFEVGGGFVNPCRAILEDNEVYVTVQDNIPGEAIGTEIENQTLSTINFKYAVYGEPSRKIPVTVHNAESFEISFVYNDNTRYTRSATADGVTMHHDYAGGDTFNVWIESLPETPRGIYEGYLVITVDGCEYSLPWAIQIAATSSGFDFIFFTERPVVSTTTDTSVRSSTFSNQNTFYLIWQNMWPEGHTDIFLADIETREPLYYFGTITGLGEGLGMNDAKYYLNIVGSTAYPIVDGQAADQKETVADGEYYLCIKVSDIAYYSSGIIYTSERPTLTIDETVFIDNDPSVTSIELRGSIYSPAIARAMELGFTWDHVFTHGIGIDTPINQSMNALGFNTAADIYEYTIFGVYASSNILLVNGSSSICNENGEFVLSFTNLTQQDKETLKYLFTSGSNHSIVAVGSYNTGICGMLLNTFPLFGFYGNNKSLPVTPRLHPTNILSDLTVENGTVVAQIQNPGEDALLMSSYSFELTDNGTAMVFTGFSYQADGDLGYATWTFDPFTVKLHDRLIEATVTYHGQTLTESLFLEKWPEATKVNINLSALTTMARGSTVQLKALTDNDDIFTQSPVEVIWATSNPNIAKVDANGLLTAVGTGTVTVSVTVVTPFRTLTATVVVRVV